MCIRDRLELVERVDEVQAVWGHVVHRELISVRNGGGGNDGVTTIASSVLTPSTSCPDVERLSHGTEDETSKDSNGFGDVDDDGDEVNE